MTCNLCNNLAFIYWRGPFCAECFAFSIQVFELFDCSGIHPAAANPAASQLPAPVGVVGTTFFPYPVELPACLDF